MPKKTTRTATAATTKKKTVAKSKVTKTVKPATETKLSKAKTTAESRRNTVTKEKPTDRTLPVKTNSKSKPASIGIRTTGRKTPVVQRKTASSVKAPGKVSATTPKTVPVINEETIRMEAYYVYLERTRENRPGTTEEDWNEALNRLRANISN